MYLNKKSIVFFLLFVLLITCLGGCCDHVWVEANCESPKTCSECGATQGDVVHNWVEANCQSPKTCSECGVTEGDVSHSFEVANCTDSVVCSICGATGDPVGHNWKDGSCAEPKRCERCGTTDGEALGHSTRYGKCSRCGKNVDELAYKDGFAVVTYKDTAWMQEQGDFVDVYVIGTITDIDKMNRVTIIDSDGEKWTVGVGTSCDLSSYIGTECEVYGFSSGGVSSQYDTPLINMDHENNRVIFIDGKTLYPEKHDTWKQFEDKYEGNFNQGGQGKVWIPTDGGTKYHSKATCSGMYNPEQVTEEEAINRGYSKCGKCW